MVKHIVDRVKTSEGAEFLAVMVVGRDLQKHVDWFLKNGFAIEHVPGKVVLAEFTGYTERVQEIEQELLNAGFEYSN